MNKRKKAIIAAEAVITVLLTLFIFWNSLQTGTDSAGMSDRIVKIVESFMSHLGIDLDMYSLSFFIRKAGHFCEYFALGCSSAVLLTTLFRQKHLVWSAAVYCFATAVCDEFIIQNATAGRSPQLSDVGIDMSGTLAGIAVIFLIMSIKNKTGNNEREE